MTIDKATLDEARDGLAQEYLDTARKALKDA